MAAKSRRKGANGELEFARLAQTFGFDCERTGRNGKTSEDVTHNIPGLHVEVKRARDRSMKAWVEQAEGDAPEGLVPAVFYRLDRDQWRVDMPAAEVLRLKALERDACATLKRAA